METRPNGADEAERSRRVISTSAVKRFPVITKSIIFLLCLFLGACAESSTDAIPAGSPGHLAVRLSVPGNAKHTGARDATVDVDVADEGRINTLTLLGYADGELAFSRSLDIPDGSTVWTTYDIRNIEAGDYSIYVVANSDAYLTADGIATEAALAGVIMDFTSTLPEAGNLPMVSQPESTVTVAPNVTATVDCALTIAAVKVRYSIVFDKEVTGAPDIGGKGLRINSMDFDGVATQAYLLKNEAASPALKTAGADFLYYDVEGTDYYNESNADESNKYIVDLGAFTGSVTPASYSGRWVVQGNIYLPERYGIIEAEPLTVNIHGDVMGSDGVTVESQIDYAITIDSDQLPRGTLYEIVGKVKTIGGSPAEGLEVIVRAAEWVDEFIDVDLGGEVSGSTRLDVDRTSITLSSGIPADIRYSTTAGDVTLECGTDWIFGGEPLFVGETVTDNAGSKILRISLNDKIQPDNIDKNLRSNVGGDPALLHIVAGNLKKQIKVTYSVEPYLSVTPVAVALQGDAECEVTVNTNLGNIRMFESDPQGTRGDDITERLLSGDWTDADNLISAEGEVNQRPAKLRFRSTGFSAETKDYFFLVSGETDNEGTLLESLIHVIVVPEGTRGLSLKTNGRL